MAFRIEPLNREHDRADFSCGEPELDTYLRERARKDVERAVAAVFVMTEVIAPGKAIGYYSLSSFAIAFSDLPQPLMKQLPKYPVLPATLIGRLARDRRFPGTGSLLLRDALDRSYRQTASVGSIAVVAEAKNDAAAAFYRAFGFAPLGANGPRLFLPMRTIEQLMRV